MVTKDNLVFALAGIIVGLISGVLIANFTPAGPGNSSGFTQPAANPPASNSQGSTQSLPEGHPPVDENAIRAQIAQQEQVLEKDPDNQQAILSLANLNFDIKNYEQAARYYEKALAKDPRNVNIITDLGSAYLWLNQSEKALEYYNRSLEIDPNHFQTLMNIGIAKMSMGDRTGAADAWDKVLQLYPNNPEAPMLRDAVQKLRSNNQGS